MFHNIISFTILLLLLLIIFFVSSTKGLIAPLIPPLSPKSPFYTQILKANNISSTTTTNFTLNESHYMKFMLSKTTFMSPNSKSEIYYKRYPGHHVMNLRIGKLVQTMYGLFDTGSAITWFQCSKRAGKTQFPIYNETRSNTYTSLNCKHEKKCDYREKCIQHCEDSTTGLCEFKITYVDGTNAYGSMATDVVMFTRPRWKVVPEFILGCSWDNSQSTMGIIGGANSNYALPRQLYPEDPKFSYCLSGDLKKINLINFGPNAILKGHMIPMKTNPHTDYFYITVLSIKVNGESIDVPPSTYEMSKFGTRGFIIDSGTMTTQLTTKAFDALKAKIEHIVGPPIKYLIFEICYAIGKFGRAWPFKTPPTIAIEYYPDFVFEFDEDRMWKPVAGSPNLECLMIIRSYDHQSVIGDMNLYNVNVGYDPGNELLYLSKTKDCPTV